MRATGFRQALVLAAAAGMLALAGCGGGDKPSPDREGEQRPDSPDEQAAVELLDAAAAALRGSESYRLGYSLQADGMEGELAGSAAFGLDDAGNATALFSEISFEGEVAEDELSAYLYLPPDLYLKRGDGSWFVQSPWNQGIAPDEEQPLGLAQPIVTFDELATSMRDVSDAEAAELNGSAALRITGSVNLGDLSTFGQPSDVDEGADVEVWLDAASNLPRQVLIETDGRDAFALTVSYSDLGNGGFPQPPPDAQPARDAFAPEAPCAGDSVAACLEAQADVAGAADCTGTGRRVCLAILGNVPADLVEHLVAHYRDEYGLTVTVLRPVAVPAELLEPQRQQVDTDALMQYMEATFPTGRDDPEAVLIGLTPVDVYDATSHYHYIFSSRRYPEDPKGVISTFRMNPEFYGESGGDELRNERVRKMLSKYIGYLYYELELSSNPRSPMYDSIGGPADVDGMTEPLQIP